MHRSQLSGTGTARCAGAFVLRAFLIGSILLGAMVRPAGAEQANYARFDHQTTGFPLDGQHLSVPCEQCHLHGIFTGTSKQCSTCHIQGNPLSAVYVPANHIPTPLPCDACHTTNSFQGTHFAHSNVMPGTCQQCHNNFNATGKGPNHIVTAQSCDRCHTTVSFASSFATFPIGHIPTAQACSTCHDPVNFVPGLMNHAGISGGCLTCHAADAPATAPLVFTILNAGGPAVTLQPTSQNYHPPTSTPPTHFPVSFDCVQCHTVPGAPMPAKAAAAGFAGGTMSHKGITGGCATCHADGQGPYTGVTTLVTESTKGAHMPISGTACENCHKSTTVPGGFAGPAMVHTGLNNLSTCGNCHENNATDLGYYGLTAKLVVRPPTSGAPPNAVTVVDAAHPTVGDCSQCHGSTTSFNTNIAQPSNHIPIGTTACTNCHTGSTAPYAPANTVMNHTGFTATCAGCHGTGKSFYGTAQTEAGGQPMEPPGSVGTAGAANHIPYGSADCVACHSASSNSAGGFKIGTAPALSPTGHAAVKSLACQTCHAAASATWYGVTATAPATNHIPMASADCAACHASNFVTGGFKVTSSPVLSVAGHAAVSSVTCNSCHENNATDLGFQGVGSSIFLRPGAAVAGLSLIDAAHATGTLATADCAQCHNTTPPFVGNSLPSAHIPLPTASTPSCATCHSAGYSPTLSKMVHSAVTSESCTTCHGAGKGPFSGTGPGTGGQPVKPPGTLGTSGSGNHIPVSSTDCVACHASTDTESGTGFKLTTTPLLSSTGHTAVNALTCQTCHAAGMAWYGTTTVVPPGTVGTSGSANHIALGTGGCTACHATNIAVGGFKISTAPSLAAAGHAVVSSLSCASCHGTGSAWYGVTSLATQLANHFPIASAACSACHASNFVAGGFKISSSPTLSVAGHAAVSSVTCNSCHENNATDLGFQGVLTQIYLRPGATMAGLSPVDAAHATGMLATANCAQCHNTTPPFTGSQLPSNHIPLPSSGAGATCTTCHSAGFTPTLSKMVHSAVTSESCTTCHGAGKGPFAGTSPGAGGQPVAPPGTLGTSGSGNHIPVSSADCVGCHASTDTESGTGFKVTGTPSLSSTGHTAVNALTCQSCHAAGMAWYGTTIVVPPGTVGTSGSANHIALGTGACTACHATNIAVGGFKISTAPSLAAAGHAVVSSLSCASCHATGSAWYGVTSLVTSLSNHIPIASAACSACHASNFVTGGFKVSSSPTLSVAGHTAVSSLTCLSCHENNATDLGFQGVSSSIYLRPGPAVAGLSLIDAGHATGTLATADCGQCHITTPPFNGGQLPSGHIPLPSSGAGATCTTCHSAGYSPTLSKMVHSAVTSESCTTCHGAGKGPFSGSGPGTGGQPVKPPGALGTSGSGNHIPVSSTDCVACHASTDTESGTGFKLTTTPLLSSTGHTAVNALTCQTCHAAGMAWYGTTTVVPPGTVGTSGSANHIALGTGGCTACHATNIAVGGFKISTAPSLAAAGHAVVSSLSCASCHATGSAWYGVTSLVTQLANHFPIASAACSACHASNFVTGGFKISSSPTLSTANHTLVSSLTCNSCHENNATDLGFQGVLAQIYLRPGATLAGLSPVDAAHATGTLAAPNDCVNCHNTTPPFTGTQLPSNHFPLPTTGAPACAVCHSAGYSPTLSKMVHSAVTSESCTTCHGAGKGPFSGTGPGTGGQPVKPPGTLGTSGSGNHIPVSSTDCVACHASTDTESGTGFKLTTTPLLSSTGHTAVNALTCQTCHAAGMAWYGTTTVVPPGTVGTSGSANHIALGTGGCTACHATNIAVGGFKISTAPSLAAAGHAVVSSLSCASCHGTGSAWYGVTSLATQLANHFPIASAACSACHASNFVAGGFKISSSPTLSVAGHAAVSSVTCNSCHENNATDLGFQGVLTQIYLRPGATMAGLSPVDAAHATGTLAAPNDCVNCHNTTPPFTGTQLPSNHFPLPATGAPACAVCHAAGYAVGKSIMLHSSVTSETCSTCHGAGKGPFAGTSQGTGGQPKQPPGTVGTSGSGNHIPVGSADCGTTCHASADAMTGAGFKVNTTPALSAAAHTAVVSSVTCAACHGSGMAWYGVTIKTPPGTVGTSGAANHIPIPSGDKCNTCHANTNYASFAGTAMNHAGISSGCASCHKGGDAWYGVAIKTSTLSPVHIPVAAAPVCEGCHSPTTFTAFGPGTAMTPTTHLQVPTSLEACTTCHENGDATKFYGATIVTRPTTTADPSHPTTGDCGNSGCHTTTPPFSGGAKPSNHIPSSATCSNCHTGYTPATTTMNHTDSGVGTAGSPVACATCHGYGAGPYYGTAQGQAGGQPLHPPGTSGGAASTAQHLPFGTTTCNLCHTSTTVPGGFKGTTVPHTNGPFMTYTRGSGKSNTGTSTPKCVSCHAPSGTKWYGTSFSTATMGSHQGSSTTADCVDCHSPTGGFAAAAAAAAKAKPRPTSGLSMRPAGSPTAPTSGLGARTASGAPLLAGSGPYSHLGVTPGSCASCHRPGGGASALPGGHLPITLSCDACHRTTAWTPAAYTHAGVGPGHCASCHAAAGNWATPKPAGHFLTARSCDVCHHNTSTWLPVMYDHLSPRYRPQTGIVRCIDCHTTNTEMVVPGLSKPAGRKALPGGPIRNQ